MKTEFRQPREIKLVAWLYLLLAAPFFSFSGPLLSSEPEFEQIFEIILQNLAQPDLGLGDEHSVELIFQK